MQASQGSMLSVVVNSTPSIVTFSEGSSHKEKKYKINREHLMHLVQAQIGLVKENLL